MVFRCIAPDWLLADRPDLRKVREGEFTDEEIQGLNKLGYNVFFLPNHPSIYNKGTTVDGSQVDVFRFIFVDFDLKSGAYPSKEAFTQKVKEEGPPPSLIVDSGGGVHVYWRVSDLDPISYLRLSRRMMRKFNTDEAVGQLFQLMRYPGTMNTKIKDNPRLCDALYESDITYTAEQLDSLLPPISPADEEYCQQHFAKTYRTKEDVKVDDIIPVKFKKLLRSNNEVRDIWTGKVEDRSKGDYRLGHILFADGFTREEAMSVLVNTGKALGRAPVHRIGYAEGIVDKIWTYEEPEGEAKEDFLSKSVKDLLAGSTETSLRGERLRCYKYFDGTEHGFRLTQVIGLVAGVGVGKTATALNFFKGFVEFNPQYDHMVVPLEQPARELAERWKHMCGDDTRLHEKVHIMSNYAEDGTYRRLSLHDIQDYIIEFQNRTGKKIGCVVIDHIGVLRKETRNGENQGLMEICQELKAFAIATNTLLVIQSQSSREKAGIGDLELDKDAAYGTQHFEAYCDFMITVWQPLKRCYGNPQCPKVTAYKFCKIRFKSPGDSILEDQRYRLVFDSSTEILSEMTQDHETQFTFFNTTATNLRKKDKKTDILEYVSIRRVDGKTDSSKDSKTA